MFSISRSFTTFLCSQEYGPLWCVCGFDISFSISIFSPKLSLKWLHPFMIPYLACDHLPTPNKFLQQISSTSASSCTWAWMCAQSGRWKPISSNKYITTQDLLLLDSQRSGFYSWNLRLFDNRLLPSLAYSSGLIACDLKSDLSTGDPSSRSLEAMISSVLLSISLTRTITYCLVWPRIWRGKHLKGN